jgi:hypothetical protein
MSDAHGSPRLVTRVGGKFYPYGPLVKEPEQQGCGKEGHRHNGHSSHSFPAFYQCLGVRGSVGLIARSSNRSSSSAVTFAILSATFLCPRN